VPLARVVAQYQNELPKFFKRYQIQPVWRADRPARGRFREFYQCDVDVLGSKSMVVEAELIAAASDALAALGFNDFVIRLNHRQVLAAVLDNAGVPRAKHDEALIALDKLEKIGREGVEKEFAERGLSQRAGGKLLGFFAELAALEHAAEIAAGEDPLAKRAALNAAIVGRLVEFVNDHEAGAGGIEELQSTMKLSAAACVASRVTIDPTLARGLSYYTGAIIEISVPDLPGSLGGGGRYDNLVGMFLGKDVPACGFSLGLERIIVVMTEREMFPRELISSPADVMVAVWNEDAFDESIALAAELRTKGLRVDLYPEADKLAKQFKYASAREIPFVAIVGDDERARGEVAIKEMKSSVQRSVKLEDAARALHAVLK
jgi:histidyl-tRNA synthetase